MHCQSNVSKFNILLLSTIAIFLTWQTLSNAQEQVILLRNGFRIGPGMVSDTNTISANANQQTSSNHSIGSLDDGLRKTYYYPSQANTLAIQNSTASQPIEITLPSSAEAFHTGNSITILGVAGLTPFNMHGRRTMTIITPSDREVLLQGITTLSPRFAKVELLHTEHSRYTLDQRLAISSIPTDKLHEILRHELNLDSPDDWLKMVSFYTQAERYLEARQTMIEALQRFPGDLADREPLVAQIEQLLANQNLEEIRLRQNSGQNEFAIQLLKQIPTEILPLETQLKLQQDVENLQTQLNTINELTQALLTYVSQLPVEDQTIIEPIQQEILTQLTFDTAPRLADFQILRRDDSLPLENKVAYAVGGWLLGPGAGIDNLAVAKSLILVRDLAREYLNEDNPASRQDLLNRLRQQEGAQPEFLDRLLENMRPPKSPPSPREGDPDGLSRCQVTYAKGEQLDYVVQVPPEYDPNRKYPCVLAIPGRGMAPDMEIDWWCGSTIELKDSRFRLGHATRHGYIVVAPVWMHSDQTSYQYTEAEQARILTCFRDALRTFSIDTDRVFVSGHYDGGTAAWDLACSHPDLWAGAVVISASAGKYITMYDENVQSTRSSRDEVPLGFYAVFGEYAKGEAGDVLSGYLSSPFYDCLAVEYNGRLREHFMEELPRIMDWMALSSHRRIRNPKEIKTTTMRAGDRFFYWLEAPAISPNLISNPFQPLNKANAGAFEADIPDPTTNILRISKIPSTQPSAWVWLYPENVQFATGTVEIQFKGKKNRFALQPDIGVMLEEARRRGDRQHVMWQMVVIP
ncbi:MAG: hypothetical protein KDB03_00850 [Planctomycetales bacterium]|nr:hypothetical protein [Planctomycetales bacterium]